MALPPSTLSSSASKMEATWATCRTFFLGQVFRPSRGISGSTWGSSSSGSGSGSRSRPGPGSQQLLLVWRWTSTNWGSSWLLCLGWAWVQVCSIFCSAMQPYHRGKRKSRVPVQCCLRIIRTVRDREPRTATSVDFHTVLEVWKSRHWASIYVLGCICT